MKPIRVLLILFFTCSTVVAQQNNSIVSEGVITAPVKAVWDAWTTTNGLKAWLAPVVDIDLRLDGEMRTNYDANGKLGDAGTITNRILAFEPERMLCIRVAKAPENFPFKAKISDMWTVLYFQPTSNGNTQLRIIGLGFGADEESQKMRQFFQQGNAYTLSQLQKYFKK